MKPSRALAILHAESDIAGSLPELMQELQIDLELRYVTDPLPDPAELELLFVLGSAEAAYDDSLPWIAAEMAWLRQVLARGVPVLGICFGSQILARVLGGSVSRNAQAEIGWTPMQLHNDWPHDGPWLNFHFDRFTPPPQATLLARTELAPQAYRCGPVMGVQFHPEITPAMFDTWIDYWEQTDAGQKFLATAGDLPQRMRAEIAALEPENRARCRALLLDFIESAAGE